MAGYRISTTRVIDSRYPLWDAYQTRFDEVAGLYDYSPHDTGSYVARAAQVASAFSGDRAALAALLEAHNRALGAPAESLAAARSLGTPGSLVVIAGQQPGVMTGPLYTFWKAVALIGLARRLQVLFPAATSVVPVFWVGSEDHDLAEIAQVDLLTPDGEIGHHVYRPGDGYPPRTSVGRLPAGPSVVTLLDQVAGSMWSTEFTGRILELLRSTAQESAGLGEWFGRLMVALFGHAGLVIADPLGSGLQALQAPVLRRMVAENEELGAAFSQGCERVRGLGFEPQVHKAPDAANLYLYRGSERIPLYRREAGRFTLGDAGKPESLSRDELLETARSKPELLSPNVVLRPLVQEAVFPLLAYVGGPGETSYFGLYRSLFHLFGRTMPVIYPRPTVTLIETTVARQLEKTGVSPEQALDLKHLQEARARHLAETDPVGIDEVFEALRVAVKREHERAALAVTPISRSLAGLAGKNREKIMAEIEWLRKKAWQHHRQNCRDAAGRFDAIEASLRPRGDFQERVFNLFPYLAKYGLELARDLAGADLVPPGPAVDSHHRLLWL